MLKMMKFGGKISLPNKIEEFIFTLFRKYDLEED